MANLLSEARQTVLEAVLSVLEGRVAPYPPPNLVAPYVWIDQPTVSTERSGGDSTFIVATFPVWAIADGADKAQVALLDDLVAQIWSACEHGRMKPVRADPQRPFGVPMDSTLRGCVVAVAVTITARTLCPPATNGATVPPVILEAV